MNKPNNYDQTRAGGEFTPIKLGGHRAIIKEVREEKTRNGRPMAVVSIDFASEDKQARYFEEQYRADTRSPKKWPYQAVQYIISEDQEGNTSRSFKSFCTAYEDSNGVSVKWGEGPQWGAQFKGRRIGVVFREVEEEYNGEIKTRRRIAWFCDDHKALEQDIPAKRLYNGPRQEPVAADPIDEWMPTDFSQDDLPFR